MNTIIYDFALDTENPETNLQLAKYYHGIGHTASAISHYLRCAERTTDISLSYNCLILIYLCFQQQKDREFTAEHILKQAITICSDRPEAYFLLSKLFFQQNKYYEAYMYSCVCLNVCDFSKNELKEHVDFDIYYSTLLIKGISCPYWENTDESIEIFKILYSNYYENFNESEKNIILNKMKEYNIETASQILFAKEYSIACSIDSDINQHLPYLLDLAQQCSHITEFGVRQGYSTRTFLYADKILRSYDLEIDDELNKLFNFAKQNNKNVEYIKANVLNIHIEQTDMLFIDTWHQYDQLKKELNKHARNVNSYIVLHDTFTFGIKGENFSGTEHLENPVGLLPALIEFMIENPEWKFKYHTINNNGLTVIQRISQ
jgi:hypothetical protein